MKKILLILLGCLVIVPAALAQPQPSAIPEQNIVLQDGTVLKGKLIEVKADSYVIQTKELGIVEIKADRIQNIANQAAIPVVNPATPEISASPDANAMQKLTPVAQNLLSDPQISAGVQELIKDPEVMKLLQDPTLLNSVMTMDTKQVQGNESAQKLMQNPKMQELMQKMSQKMNVTTQPQPGAPAP